MSSTWLFMNMCISLFGRLILCLRLKRPEGSCTVILCEMSTPPSSLPALAAKFQQFAAVETGSLGPGEEGPSPVVASGARGTGWALRQGRWWLGALPPLLGDRSGGRADGRTQARRPGGGPALECSFLGQERLCTRVQTSLGWGFAPSPPPPLGPLPGVFWELSELRWEV